MENSEILVHISAPSGVRDDAQYRAQVQAILGFQSISRQVITFKSDYNDDSTDSPSSTGNETGPQHRSADVQSGKESRNAITSHSTSVEITPQISQNVNHLISRSNSLENCITISDDLSSPRISSSTAHAVLTTTQGIIPPESPQAKQQHGQFPKDSLDSPVSVIPDSQPQAQPTAIEDLQPSSPKVPKLTSADNPPSKRRRLGSPSTVQGGVETQSRTLQPTSGHENQQQCDNDKSAVPDNIDSIYPNSRVQSPSKSVRKGGLYIYLDSLPIEIKPPLPPVSMEPFVTHITPTLAMLAQRLKPARTFKPVKQSRELDQLERGYWYLRINIYEHGDYLSQEQDTRSVNRDSRLQNPNFRTDVLHADTDSTKDCPNNWELTFFSRFWSFLSDFISKEGRAGWGVWCILEDAPDTLSSSLVQQPVASREQAESTSHDPTITTRSNMRPVILKIYTWGEIASHIYLLLFLASERQIRKMGAQWRDARDEIVIEMP